jgi:hypothetical protein
VGILMRSGSNEPWSLLTSFQLAQYKTFGLAIEEAKKMADQWATGVYRNCQVRCAFLPASASDRLVDKDTLKKARFI